MAFAFSLDDPLAPPLPIHRFTVEQYQRLGDLGLITPEDRVELLEGWIVKKMNQRPVHGFIVRWLNEFFMRELPIGWICQCQLPITTERSEPEPDLAVLKGVHADFRNRHPSGADCRLVIEIADTSLERDRAKVNIYRDAGVQEYWIINVGEKVLERFEFSTMQSIEPQIFKSSEMVALKIGDSVLELMLNKVLE
jgi:Uma2 family endonuclease